MKIPIDITGQRFGKLVVVEFVGRNKRSNALWKCKCDCGGTSIVIEAHLRSGNTKSCDCSRREIVDIVGQVFGRLTVTAYAGKSPSGRPMWACACVCGGKTTARADSLKAGRIRSCRCLYREPIAKTLAKLSRNHTAHGQSGGSGGRRKASPTYTSWTAMKTRCGNASKPTYYDTKVCDRWRDSFENFLTDMGERPAGTSLGRFGDAGNYEPGNVAWRTPKEQAANRRPDRRYCGGRKKKNMEQTTAHHFAIGIGSHQNSEIQEQF